MPRVNFELLSFSTVCAAERISSPALSPRASDSDDTTTPTCATSTSSEQEAALSPSRRVWVSRKDRNTLSSLGIEGDDLCGSFKFKSSRDFETITFENDFISIADLKVAIVERKRLNCGEGFDLDIKDAQTGESKYPLSCCSGSSHVTFALCRILHGSPLYRRQALTSYVTSLYVFTKLRLHCRIYG
jgi:DWNN domain